MHYSFLGRFIRLSIGIPNVQTLAFSSTAGRHKNQWPKFRNTDKADFADSRGSISSVNYCSVLIHPRGSTRQAPDLRVPHSGPSAIHQSTHRGKLEAFGNPPIRQFANSPIHQFANSPKRQFLAIYRRIYILYESNLISTNNSTVNPHNDDPP